MVRILRPMVELLVWLLIVLAIAYGMPYVLDKYARRCPQCKRRLAMRTTGNTRRETDAQSVLHELYECRQCSHELWVTHRGSKVNA